VLNTNIVNHSGFSLNIKAKRSKTAGQIYLSLNRKILDENPSKPPIFDTNYDLFLTENELDNLIATLTKIRHLPESYCDE